MYVMRVVLIQDKVLAITDCSTLLAYKIRLAIICVLASMIMSSLSVINPSLVTAANLIGVDSSNYHSAPRISEITATTILHLGSFCSGSIIFFNLLYSVP
jgi:hypothetical protein